MRFAFGIILGGLLTIGGAYIHDQSSAAPAAGAPAAAQRSLVNWDVVAAEWQRLTLRVRGELHRLSRG